LAVAWIACGSEQGGPSGNGGSAGYSGGAGGTSGSAGNGTGGAKDGGGSPDGVSGGKGGAAGTSGSGGSGGAAGASGTAGRGGAAGVGGGGAGGAGGVVDAGKGGAGGAAGVDGGSGSGGTAGTAGKGGSSGGAGAGGASGAAGSAGTPGDGGPNVDAARDLNGDASVPIQGPESFHCVNWADPRDNFVNGNLELSGLSAANDTYATVQSKANDILGEFQAKLKADSIRIPINEPTVSGAWWNAYKAVIDAAVGKGMKVVIAYWAYQNGKPADAVAFKNMWQTVVSAYQGNNLVYFDIHNEPYGYANAWLDAAAQWLTDFPNVPRGRVIVAGTGYDDNVNSVGADARFAGCILQLHIYGFWHDDWTAQKQWTDSMKSALGSYASRTIVGEWGAPMTTGIDYTNMADGDAYRSYVLAVSNVMRDAGMGSCYWPGLRNGDSYSMTTLNAKATPLTLSVNSTTGLGRLHWAWKLP
jgi:endoglucanase